MKAGELCLDVDLTGQAAAPAGLAARIGSDRAGVCQKGGVRSGSAADGQWPSGELCERTWLRRFCDCDNLDGLLIKVRFIGAASCAL